LPAQAQTRAKIYRFRPAGLGGMIKKRETSVDKLFTGKSEYILY
jgi:hypothetical protein